MARSADPELRRWWRELIDSFDSTRESVAQFCRRHEVSTASFYRWRRKLISAASRGRSAAGTKTTNAKGSTTDRRLPARSPAFLPLQVIDAQGSPPPSVQVHLAGGVSIELPIDQQELLFDVLAHVRGSSRSDPTEAVR